MSEAESKQTDDFSAMVENLVHTNTAEEVRMELQRMESIVSAQDDIEKFKRVADDLKQTGRLSDDVQRQYDKILSSLQDNHHRP